jgi:hypothetical protein
MRLAFLAILILMATPALAGDRGRGHLDDAGPRKGTATAVDAGGEVRGVPQRPDYFGDSGYGNETANVKGRDPDTGYTPTLPLFGE